MIKVIYGEKGIGKTKVLVDSANQLAEEGVGDIVFIDHSDKLMYGLKRNIRFVNVNDFPRMEATAFLGFICGIVSEDYDIKGIFIDGLDHIVGQNADSLQTFFNGLKQVSEKYDIHFHVSMNGNLKKLPDYIKEFVA